MGPIVSAGKSRSGTFAFGLLLGLQRRPEVLTRAIPVAADTRFHAAPQGEFPVVVGGPEIEGGTDRKPTGAEAIGDFLSFSHGMVRVQKQIFRSPYLQDRAAAGSCKASTTRVVPKPSTRSRPIAESAARRAES